MPIVESPQQSAFVLRMYVGKDDVPYGLDTDRITVGWAEARGLIEVGDDHYAIRKRVLESYRTQNVRWAGNAAGVLRRFLHQMRVGDRVLVPRGGDVFLAKVDGAPSFDEERIDDGIAYYRPVEWLNEKRPYPRHRLPSNLQFAAGKGTRNTCREVKACLPEILKVEAQIISTETSFQTDLHQCLVERVRDELLRGKMNETSFEYFLLDLFERFGATGSVRRGLSDKGGDVVLDMPLGNSPLRQRVVVQAKFHHPVIGPEAVKQCQEGMEAEEAELGVVVTTGEFSPEAQEESTECGLRIELVDGQQLASMVVEAGVSLPSSS